MEKSYKRILLLGIGFILCGTLAAQEQKQDSTEGKNNIKASEYLMPKRKGAEKFHSKRGSEHLFFSVGSGIGYLFNVGGGQTAHGPRASFMAGNWLTPVIGLRAGGEYTQWKQGNTDMHLAGANVDYLINISAIQPEASIRSDRRSRTQLSGHYRKRPKNNPFIRIEGRTTRETECIVCF